MAKGDRLAEEVAKFMEAAAPYGEEEGHGDTLTISGNDNLQIGDRPDRLPSMSIKGSRNIQIAGQLLVASSAGPFTRIMRCLRRFRQGGAT